MIGHQVVLFFYNGGADYTIIIGGLVKRFAKIQH